MRKTKKGTKRRHQKGGGTYEFTGNFAQDLQTIQNYNNYIRNNLVYYNDQNKTLSFINYKNIINVVVGDNTIPGPISLLEAYNAFVIDGNNIQGEIKNYFNPGQWQYLFVTGNTMDLFVDIMQTFNMFLNAGDNFYIQNQLAVRMQDGNFDINNLITTQDQIEKNYNYVREKLTILMNYDKYSRAEQELVLQAIEAKKGTKTQIPELVDNWSKKNKNLKDNVYPQTDAWFNTHISKIYVICITLLNYYLEGQNQNLQLSEEIIDYVDNIITYQLQRSFLRLKSLEYSAQELINNPNLNYTVLSTRANIRGNYMEFKDFRKEWIKVKKQKLETIEKIKKLYKKATPTKIQKYQQKQQQPFSYTDYQQAYSRSITPQPYQGPSQRPYSTTGTPQLYQGTPQQPYSRAGTPQPSQQQYSKARTPQPPQPPQQKQQQEEQTEYQKTTDSELEEYLRLDQGDIKYINNLKDGLNEIVKDALLTFTIDKDPKNLEKLKQNLEKLKSEHPKKNRLHKIIDKAIKSKQ